MRLSKVRSHLLFSRPSPRADNKILAQLRFHLSSCDYILLGGTHDGGYAKTLHRLEASSRNKILLALTHSNIIASALKELSLDQVVLPQNLFEKVESKGLIGRKFGTLLLISPS